MRLSYGAALLIAPGPAVSLVGVRPGRAALTVTRILGARHLVQSLALATWSGSTTRRIAAVVDVAHAGSAAALGFASRRYRRVGLVDTAIALTFAGTEAAALQ